MMEPLKETIKLKERVTVEVATKEVNGWLDTKKVDQRRREKNKDQIDTLIDALVDGSLSLSSDGSFTQVLKFKTEGDGEGITELKYKARLKVVTIHNYLKGVKSDDPHGMVLSYVAALTTQPKNVIKDLDTEDYAIGQSIAIFFM